MTRIVALLEAKGLVRLEPHPEDRRQKVVTQTEQAEAMLEESRRKRNAWLAALAEGLDRGRVGQAARRRPRPGEARAPVGTHAAGGDTLSTGTGARLRVRPAETSPPQHRDR